MTFGDVLTLAGVMVAVGIVAWHTFVLFHFGFTALKRKKPLEAAYVVCQMAPWLRWLFLRRSKALDRVLVGMLATLRAAGLKADSVPISWFARPWLRGGEAWGIHRPREIILSGHLMAKEGHVIARMVLGHELGHHLDHIGLRSDMGVAKDADFEIFAEAVAYALLFFRQYPYMPLDRDVLGVTMRWTMGLASESYGKVLQKHRR